MPAEGYAFTRGLHEIADGIHAFLQPDGGWGLSNAVLVRGEGASLLVDTFFDLALTRELLDATSAVTAAAPIATLVNTHAHGDHAWGNQLVGGAEIVGSRACAEEMTEASPETYAAILADPDAFGTAGAFFGRAFARFSFEGIRVTPPTRTFEGGLTVDAGGRELRLIEVGPAHTRGDVIVHVPAEHVVVTGDVLFAGGHPVTFTGSVDGWLRALDRVLALEPALIVPGHGPIAGVEDVIRLRAYFEHVRAEARARYDAGLAALDAAREIPLDAFTDWDRPERVASTVAACYRDFAGTHEEADVLTTATMMAELAC